MTISDFKVNVLQCYTRRTERYLCCTIGAESQIPLKAPGASLHTLTNVSIFPILGFGFMIPDPDP